MAARGAVIWSARPNTDGCPAWAQSISHPCGGPGGPNAHVRKGHSCSSGPTGPSWQLSPSPANRGRRHFLRTARREGYDGQPARRWYADEIPTDPQGCRPTRLAVRIKSNRMSKVVGIL
jgi:hypothetical protein